MRKHITVAFLALIAMTITFYACKKSNVPIQEQPNTHTVASEPTDPCDLIYDDIGLIHNNALAYAFDKIQDESLLVGVDNAQEVNSLVTGLANEYITSYFSHTFTSSETADILDAAINPYPTSAYSTVFNQKMAEVMSEYNTAADVDAYKTFALAYLQNNISSIPASEQVVFRSAILISFNSWEYWNGNYIAWVNEYNSQNGLPEVSGRVDPRGVGKADIEGCIGGAALGIGGGPVGVCLGAPTGAIYGSAINCLMQCIFPEW